MRTATIALISVIVLALSACSENDDSPTLLSDSTEDLNVNNYRAELHAALKNLRGEYFDIFIEAPSIANRLFSQPLPDATDYFGADPFPTGTESIDCDSGLATRNVTLSDAQLLTIEANFTFEDCSIQGVLYNGQAVVELDGDTPSRLGGQSGEVAMQFNDMEIKTGDSLDSTRTLNGSFANRSGWGAAKISYIHSYVTEAYTETGAGVNITINNASYTQQMDSDYYPPENSYYRLSETGSLTLSGTIDQQQINYSVTIDPALLYSSQLNNENLPVYDDNIASGTITYERGSGASVIVSQANSDAAMAFYEVSDTLQILSEVDEWLFPIACDDNSPMNSRDLCANRR